MQLDSASFPQNGQNEHLFPFQSKAKSLGWVPTESMENNSDHEEDGDVDAVNDNKTGSYFTPSSNFRTFKQRHRDADFSTADEGVEGRCSWAAPPGFGNFTSCSKELWWSRVEDKVVAFVIEDSLKVNPLHHIAATSIARAGDGC